MSYSFRVTSKDGELTVEKTTTEVPDGIWNVNGHETGGGESVSVSKTVEGKNLTATVSLWSP